MIAVCVLSADRKYHLSATLLSLKNANIKEARYIIFDDASSKETLEVIKHFQDKTIGSYLIQSSKKMGLPGLAEAFRAMISKAKDLGCEHLILFPDDIVVNPYLGECIEKAKTMLDADTCAVQFFNDSRGSVFLKDKAREYNEHFDIIGGVDGFAVLMRTDYASSLDWTVDMDEAVKTGRSLIWRKIALQMNNKRILQVKKSLVEHCGNNYNATLKRPKAGDKYIYGVNLNLFSRPEWL